MHSLVTLKKCTFCLNLGHCGPYLLLLFFQNAIINGVTGAIEGGIEAETSIIDSIVDSLVGKKR